MTAALILAIAIPGAWAMVGRYSISWKESEVNSVARRAWTAQAASFLAANTGRAPASFFRSET